MIRSILKQLLFIKVMTVVGTSSTKNLWLSSFFATDFDLSCENIKFQDHEY